MLSDSSPNDDCDTTLNEESPTEIDQDSLRVLKWTAQEIKPQIQDKVWDDYILRHAALHVFHEPLSGWTDDVADYFNHIPIATSEYWVSCLLWSFHSAKSDDTGWTSGLFGFHSGLETSPVTIVSEHRLGFGVSLSSNIGQLFAEAFLDSFRRSFDAEENVLFDATLDPSSGTCTPYNSLDFLTLSRDGWTDVCRWIHERRRLSSLSGVNQLRRYSVHMYTDDPVFTIVGADAVVRAMRCWHQTTISFRLKMAIARKRQVGTRLTWLGFDFYLTPGIFCVSPDKLMRARSSISSILEGGVTTFDTYRRLIGLLEHLLPFISPGRSAMYGLYGKNFQRGIASGPSTLMYFYSALI